MSQIDDLPVQIESEEQLEELLSRPSPAAVEFAATLSSPLVILGAGGKMGPSLVRMARRAGEMAGRDLQVIAVSRFSNERTRRQLESHGVVTISADLMKRDEVERLPDADSVISMVGLKFGTTRNPATTWALNTLAPAHIAQRYRAARIVAMSTGNVYPLVPVASGGAVESDPATPQGEYAGAAVARERIFQYHAIENGTPIALLRLNYAVELRWGVLVDIARWIHLGRPVDVSMGYLNCIWLADANDMILRSLSLATPEAAVLNLTGPDTLSVRDLALMLAERMGRPVEIAGSEAETALLSNSERICELLGSPATSLETLLAWTAAWVAAGKPSLDQPTHFEVRDGRY